MALESKYASNTARLFDTQNRSLASLEARLSALEDLVLLDGGNQPEDGFPNDGTTFPKNTLAEENGWLMRANKETPDYPGPRASGIVRWASGLGDTPTWSETTVSASALIVGFRFTMPSTEGAFGRAFRYWLPATAIGFRVEVWSVGDPTGAQNMTKLLSFVAAANDVDQWVVVSIGQSPIGAGAIFDLALVILPATGADSFSYEWDYERKNGNPDQGKIWHQSGANQDQMRVHQEDKDSVNRSTDLDNIGPGSTIEITGYTWTVQSASKTGSVYTFIVDPATRAGSDTYTFRFTYYSALPIPYVYITDQNVGNDLVDGFISTTDYAGITINQNAYGVDAQLEGAILSPDWDFRAYSTFSAGGGGGTGGGGGGGETLLQVIDAAGLAEVIIPVSSGYTRYRLQYDGMTPTTDDTEFGLRYSDDNGSTYVNADYQWSTGTHWQTNAAFDGQVNDTQFPISRRTGNAATNYEYLGEFHLFRMDNRIQVLGHFYGNDYQDRQIVSNLGGCSRVTHNEITHLRLAADGVKTFASGTFRLYGL